MKLSTAMTAAAILAAGSIGLAGPARADDEFSGTYNLAMGANTFTWTVTPCEGDPFIPCVHIAETGGENAPFQGDAYLTVGSWSMRVDRSDAITCEDNSKVAAPVTYSWDAVTLIGYISIFNPGLCGVNPVTLYAPIQLTKVPGPLSAEA
ncbi:MAG TPA: hypothetical protein VMD51_03805 [Mycobacterium sp.]|nr:hypothetical protein [Mycobacterium sp.]